MYLPRPFEETRTPVLHQLMRAHPLASLVTIGASGLFASHLPLVLHPELGPLGNLRGHFARANQQHYDRVPGVAALAIFSGPEHYITPNWYPEKQATAKVVPTWNYAVVHVYGQLRIVDGNQSPEAAAWLLEHLNTLTDTHEAASPQPWKVSDAPADFIASQMKGIVGLELVIDRIEGKWKASQNRSAADRAGVIHGLDQLDTPASQAMKSLVTAASRPGPDPNPDRS
jgi:transcriptional regulator